jgi:plasmid stabilization system protein ParE
VPRLRFAAAAQDDLVSIAEYSADCSGSRAVAERFMRELRGKCAQLAAAPIQMGRTRADLRPDLRSHSHRSYVIFFRYEGGVLEIVRVIESHRDIPPLFGDDV